MTIEESYRHCEAVARSRAKNFYYSFLLLPREKRLAMCAVYAFMRECDDLSDEAGASLDKLAAWRADMDRALRGEPTLHAVWPAFADAVARYRIPGRYFHEMIDGVSSDLTPRAIRSFDDLYGYCYHVASVVGLTIIHIFGFEDPRALELAEKCGIAFQLTNILRDVKEDALNGRVYLPDEDLTRFTVAPEQLKGNEVAGNLAELLRFEGARARAYFDESQPLLELIHRDSRAALWALMEIYRRLLDRIEASGYAVLNGRIRLSKFEKLSIVARAGLRR
jgi:phytoene synthase